MKWQIMLVDDEPGVLALVSSMLKRKGFGVITASKASEAIHLLDTITPDLFILDIMMPGISGIELCKRLRAEPSTAQIPIIILSARNDSETINACYDSGANSYVPKLTLHRELIGAIQELLSAPDQVSAM
jgi:DNA-binding response OmpR family regulator